MDVTELLAIKELSMLGVGIDWRRCFLTTNNPYYESFMRWHFQILSDQNKLEFIPQFVAHSTQDGMVADQKDPTIWHSLLPHLVPMVKLRVLDFPKRLSASLQDKEVYFLGEVEIKNNLAEKNVDVETLEIPALPDWGAFRANGYNQIYICDKKTAKGLAFQQSIDAGEIDCLMDIDLQEIREISLRTPLNQKITISVSRYADVMYRIPRSLLGLSEDTAQTDANEVKAKLVGDWIDRGDAFMYGRLNRHQWRSSHVVGLTKQWMIKYNDLAWKDQVLSQLKSTQLCRRSQVLLKDVERAEIQNSCLSQGLGPKLSQNNFVGSSSDSLLIPAYATISHLLQGNPQGSIPGKLGIRHEDMTKEVWDYLMLGNLPKDRQLPRQADLERIKSEFEYWYPLDVLNAQEHSYCLQMLFNHVAVFPKYFPRSIVYHPKHISYHANNKKESVYYGSSTWRIIELADLLEGSADVIRMLLVTIPTSIGSRGHQYMEKFTLALCRNIKWAEGIISNSAMMRDGSELRWEDSILECSIVEVVQKVETYYKQMNYRAAFVDGYYILKKARSRYRHYVRHLRDMNRNLILKFLEVQAIILSPIIPHYSQHIFDILNKNMLIQKAVWPEMTIDQSVLVRHQHFEDLLRHLFKNKPRKPSEAIIYVAKSFPAWINDLLACVPKTQQPWSVYEIWQSYDATKNTD
eukprot:TRINITY_DN7901_c0_g1_i1.p1 TRINITY_DN7901_c0_g1~~TRINITY_DN7901_c0_g1_i1.p1  ORF type:complete len:690 (-),score=100.71 TRINITY_DN7901_c0_g1_i1:291-2360(-)